MDLNSERERAGNTGSDPQAQETEYPNVEAFVRLYLHRIISRRFSEEGRAAPFQWCAQWWRHPEATARLDALWQAWEQLRKEPGTAATVWWRDYFDPTFRELFSERGPFDGCTPDRHDPKGRKLPLVSPPKGLFD